MQIVWLISFSSAFIEADPTIRIFSMRFRLYADDVGIGARAVAVVGA
jgi:hypothetical protein